VADSQEVSVVVCDMGCNVVVAPREVPEGVVGKGTVNGFGIGVAGLEMKLSRYP
jgi:hypothetical protein